MSEKQEFKYTAWNKVEREFMNEKIDRELITGDKLMLARVFIKKTGTCRCTIITTNKSLTSLRAR